MPRLATAISFGAVQVQGNKQPQQFTSVLLCGVFRGISGYGQQQQSAVVHRVCLAASASCDLSRSLPRIPTQSLISICIKLVC